MKELSLNILDIAQNSVKAGATLVEIQLTETAETLTIRIVDNGCGMTAAQVESVMDPFFTTRTTRSVGLGVPLLKLAAEQTGGSVEIASSAEAADHGTAVTALFYKNHIDFTPLGDIISTVTALIQGAPGIDWRFVHSRGGDAVTLDTRELRAVLGDVPLDQYDVMQWIGDYLREGYEALPACE
ncbi:MAG: sensor histidine kinase [Clostridia bacterium]|nr:sensor histidine kinase [Clostridia bacterium]